jgi:hypothetical protein
VLPGVSDMAMASLLPFCKVSPALSASVWETGMRNGGIRLYVYLAADRICEQSVYGHK